MGDFHFLRPWWLAALPIGILLILRLARSRAGTGAWRKVVDTALQPFVLSEPAVFGERRWPIAAALAAWIIATLALAGPTWQRVPVPAFRSNEALVVALDLSRSMDAADLQPSRLARARLKLLSLLDRRKGGQTGLVVFSADAFTVTPLTTDTRTIASLVSALTTDIMPTQGTSIEAGLDKAETLLRQAHVTQGEVLLISDAPVSRNAMEKARALRRAGYKLSVLGVGTAQGAPIPERNGGFVTDDRGQVVVPRVDTGALARLAEAGGGRFASLRADDRDLDVLAPRQKPGAIEQAAVKDKERHAELWSDAGRWLTLLLLPIAALGFRRGWICLWIACAWLPLASVHAQTSAGQPSPPASNRPAAGKLDLQEIEGGHRSDTPFWKEAWQSLWRRADQRGADALKDHLPGDAARLFENPEWRAAAQYEAGDYKNSAATLGSIDTADADYNRGNALARAGQLQGAVSAYDRSLELDPDNRDAQYNRGLVQRLIQERKSQGDPGKDKKNNESTSKSGQQQASGSRSSGNQQGGGDRSGSAEAQQGQGDARHSPENGTRNGQGRAGDRPSSDEATAGGDSDSGGADHGDRKNGSKQGSAEQGAENKRKGGAEREAPAPQDVEKWASQQAAEQWLRRIPQDPGGLLRRKFLYQYQRLGVDQDGRYIRGRSEKEPW